MTLRKPHEGPTVRPTAKDIDTLEVLSVIDSWDRPDWRIGASVVMINGWDRVMPFEDRPERWPEKILRAKLSWMLRNGLIDGCCCGCRGDFTLTDKGRSMLHEKVAERYHAFQATKL